MSQPFLIELIIKFIPGMVEVQSVSTPACSSIVLTKDKDGEPRKEVWNYCVIIGMLNYLVNCTHRKLSFSVHQCAQFCNNPKQFHEQAVKRIICYLPRIQLMYPSKDKAMIGILFQPNKTKDIKTYMDDSFAGK